MPTRKPSTHRPSRFLNFFLAAFVLCCGLILTPRAEALLINQAYPDITLFEIDVDPSAFSATTLPSTGVTYIPSEGALPNFLSNVNFELKYGSGLNNFSLTGNLLDDDFTAFALSGTIIDSFFGSETYKFLVQLSTQNFPGFDKGGAGIIISRLGGIWQADVVPAPVPEPATLTLLAAGLAGLRFMRRRRD